MIIYGFTKELNKPFEETVKMVSEELKKGMELQKDEIIQLHAFLLHVRNHLEYISEDYDQDVFSSYDALNIAPHKVNRSKDEQRLAVFELCKGISKMMMGDKPSALKRICKNLENLCAQYK